MTLPDDTAVLHTRLGDVVDNASKSWRNNTPYAKNNLVYACPQSFYEKFLPLLPKAVTRIVISSSYCHHVNDKSHLTQSAKFVGLLKDFLKGKGFIVRVHVNCGTPDEDFLFMSTCQLPGTLASLKQKTPRSKDDRRVTYLGCSTTLHTDMTRKEQGMNKSCINIVNSVGVYSR